MPLVPPPQQVPNIELRSKLPKKSPETEERVERGAGTAVRCWRTELLPAQTRRAHHSTALAPSAPKIPNSAGQEPKGGVQELPARQGPDLDTQLGEVLGGRGELLAGGAELRCSV